MNRTNFYPKTNSLSGLVACLLLLTMLPLATVHGQVERKAYSLQKAIDFALAHHNSMKIAKVDEYLAQKRVTELTAIGLPQVNAYATFTDNLVIPTTVVPASQFDPLAPEDLFIELQFGVQYTAQTGAQISQLVFSGSYLYGVKAAKEYVKLSQKNTERSKVETAENVSKAYYSSLIASKQFEILQSNLKRVLELKRSMDAMYKEGFIEKLDVDRMEITYQNLLTEQSKVARLVALSADLLKFQMGLDINTPIILTDTLDSPDNVPPVVNFDDGSNYHVHRAEYQMLEMQEGLHQLNAKRIKAAAWPSLAAFGDLGYSWSAPKFNMVSDGDFWFPFAVVGLQLNMPLFTGRSGWAQKEQSLLEAEKVRLNMSLFEDVVQMELKRSRVTLMNAHNTVMANKGTVELAKNVARVTKIKYEEGVGSNLEVIEAQNTLRESETNYLTSLYEYKLAEIDLKKAKGQLLK